jgi:very-short-patch-repair endonuclease
LQNLHDVERLLEGSTGNRKHLASLLTDIDSASRSWDLAEILKQFSTRVQALLDDGYSAPEVERVKRNQITLVSFAELIGEAAPTVDRIEKVVAIVLTRARRELDDLLTLQGFISSGVRLRILEDDHYSAPEILQADFGVRFKGFDTDWTDVLDCLSWAAKLTEMVPSDRLTPTLLLHIEQPKAPETYEQISESFASARQQFRTQTDSLMETYQLDEGPWDSWRDAKFDSIKDWSKKLMDDANSASDWMLYQAAVENLDVVLGPSTTEQIRNETQDSELVSQIIERRIFGSWLDWIYEQEPLLATFASSEQEDLIAKFKELDEQLPVAAQTEVRKRVLQQYPNLHGSSVRGSQLGILRGELSKQRRQWPVRRLFQRIPRLIQTLKPCFFMSPLAVSQYLPLSDDASETLMFDVVIFDEASQVFPEDAVPAILRGTQLILAGDRQQLPPSNFWRRSLSDDDDDTIVNDDDDTEIDQLVGRESILDAAIGLLGRPFEDAHLRVHYRSKDESLIRFSNNFFYRDNPLLTFPSPGITDSWYGVHDVFVPDGRYDAGSKSSPTATRTNRKEAERVVDLVFEHFRTRPVGETLGVAALSRAQADLIEQLVEERKIQERDLDGRFNERPREPFFVKNLERVQGDERDHIIISIGYGPTVESGVVHPSFGPMIQEGGDRRLNVLVSRARQRVDLVHSLRATDIHSQQKGGRLLRRYLEYAENPEKAFEAHVTMDSSAELESPFEEAVESALISRGHKVARQVGVSGYRIDLSILSEDGTKHDLGIECDGATYHSTAAARDRDWLRQQVLEGLGWKIHRIWSTSWIRNAEAELTKVEESLAAARSRLNLDEDKSGVGQPIPEPSSDLADSDSPMEIINPSTPLEFHLEPYQKAPDTLPPTSGGDLQYEPSDNLIKLITSIVEVEGPVHKDVVIDRIRDCYGLGQIRSRNRDKILRHIDSAQTNGDIRGDKKAASLGNFIWFRDEQLNRAPRSPADITFGHIPPTELETITVSIARAEFGVPRRDLITAVARRMGFERTGPRITEQLEYSIQELLIDGRLVESFGMIHVPGSGSDGKPNIGPSAKPGEPSAVRDEPSKPANTSQEPTAAAKPTLRGGPRRRKKVRTSPTPTGRTGSLVERLRSHGLDVKDMRAEGGVLWVIGGPELDQLLKEFKEVRFEFAPSGNNDTNNWFTRESQPAWWTSDKSA